MRKLLTILLAATYLALSSGVVLSVHYCMGEVAGVALGHAQSEKCDDCGMDNQGCCKDDVRIIKVADSHSLAATAITPEKPDAIAHPSIPAGFNGMARDPLAAIAPILPSPDTGQPSLYIRHRVFRI